MRGALVEAPRMLLIVETVLFIVLMILWLSSSLGVVDGLNRYMGLLPWACVATLAAIVASVTHAFHF